LDIQFKIKKIGKSSILYDEDILTDPSLQLFDADYHTNLESQQSESSQYKDKVSPGGIGRARVIYFSYGDKTLVLKHYFRGGMVSSFLKDQYFGFNLEKTRAFREWCLLKTMLKLGLPVPDAIAAHAEQHLFFYRADLITQKIDDTKTLADVLIEKEIDSDQWRKIASCIKKFHDNNIYHADLNARNILLTGTGEVYLIDFDNSDFRVGSNSWKMGNLTRLKRSLLKFKKNESCFNFSEDNWLSFLEGYDQAIS